MANKKGIIINVLIWMAMTNLAIVVIFFIINAIKMSHLVVNSDEWFSLYGLMIKYIGWGCCSHIPIIIASFVNTSRYRDIKPKSGTNQYIYGYNPKSGQYELKGKTFIPKMNQP